MINSEWTKTNVRDGNLAEGIDNMGDCVLELHQEWAVLIFS